MSKPEGVVLITENGARIAVDLKHIGVDRGVDYWVPVLEVNLDLVMPSVIQIDADRMPVGAALQIPAGPGYDTAEWGNRIFANSPVLTRYVPGGMEA